jgi:catechol 2,3-dioxygenase-like lactoylglutathione lyase family enzyme
VLASAALVAFVGSADLERSRHFYESVLGLEVADHGPYAVALDAHGTTLRVTAVPQVSVAAYTVLGWTVADITATVAALARADVRTERFEMMDQDEAGIWTTPGGDRVAWFKDPDGNTLSVTQIVRQYSRPSASDTRETA